MKAILRRGCRIQHVRWTIAGAICARCPAGDRGGRDPGAHPYGAGRGYLRGRRGEVEVHLGMLVSVREHLESANVSALDRAAKFRTGSRVQCSDATCWPPTHEGNQFQEATVLDQRMTNDTPQPNKNKRDRTSSNATLIVRFFRLFRRGRAAHNGLVGG
jgi:hypothetical protein